MTDRFDDIRPYYDAEIPAAMHRIAQCEAFSLLASFVFPNKSVDEAKSLLLSCSTIKEFQQRIMVPANEQIIARSISALTYSGLENVGNHGGVHLYVANHRDIMLDASLSLYILTKNGYESGHITFGANLMSHPTVIDVGKSNKMFRVERGGNQRDFYMSSHHLSDYIRHVITVVNESVWIAQRNGRTKDGIDATDQGIIKMFGLSYNGDKINGINELSILPICVSYEWEPCDMLKAMELYSSRHERYVKKPGEDLNSILTGILQPKGRVHFVFCEPIKQEELSSLSDLTATDFHRAVASLIDHRIWTNYRLYPNNYIAHDLLFGQQRYAHYYTPDQKAKFVDKMSRLQQFDVERPEVLQDIYLGIYANPVTKSEDRQAAYSG